MGIVNARRLIFLTSLAVAASVLLPSGAAHAGAGHGHSGFAMANGTRFTVGGRPFHSHGFNAYWLMYMASEPGEDRGKVSGTLEQAARLGARLVRTWAFSDGGSNRPLQISPGVYNEDMFKVYMPSIHMTRLLTIESFEVHAAPAMLQSCAFDRKKAPVGSGHGHGKGHC